MKNLVLFSVALALLIAVGGTFASGFVRKTRFPEIGLASQSQASTALTAEMAAPSVSKALFGVDRISIPGSSDLRIRVDPAIAAGFAPSGIHANGIPYTVNGQELVVYQDIFDRGTNHDGYDIVLPELKLIKILGSGSLTVLGPLVTDNLEIIIQGSGSVTARLELDFLKLNIAGSGNAILEGQVKNLNLNVFGSGDLLAPDLTGNSADLTIMGSGDSQIGAFKQLNIQQFGSGDISYRGSPVIDRQAPGSGSLISR